MPSAGLERAILGIERPQTYALNRTTTAVSRTEQTDIRNCDLQVPGFQFQPGNRPLLL